jgi:hypothetical protein
MRFHITSGFYLTVSFTSEDKYAMNEGLRNEEFIIAIVGEMYWLQMKILIITSAFNTFSELLPNLYYSPIEKLENIFIFKIVRQKRP